ncbi:MAG: deaminase domain-containing protein [Anaerofustis sp.]
MNQIAGQLGDRYDAKGTITLFTERRPCPSCARNINQFQQRYPNIEIIVVHNDGINILKEK